MKTFKRSIAAAVAIGLALVLTGCGPDSGTVVDKAHEPASWYWTTCYRSESTTINGHTTSRQVPYSCQQYKPESYRLYLREDVGVSSSREPEEGWRGVDTRVYMACEVGQFYEDGACR